MFTGIVEEVGIIKEIKLGQESSKISIEGNRVLEGTKIGDSICSNGVCLTVVALKDRIFQVDIMAETLRRSNLRDLKIGDKINLERALTLETHLGGHIVSGHIDGVGVISSIVNQDNSVWITINAESNILKYVVEKGSIAIDGVSLTVAYVDDKKFKVSIIPHTARETTLLCKNIGNTVNLECDLIAKYIEKLLSFKEANQKDKLITEKFLFENGFLE